MNAFEAEVSLGFEGIWAASIVIVGDMCRVFGVWDFTGEEEVNVTDGRAVCVYNSQTARAKRSAIQSFRLGALRRHYDGFQFGSLGMQQEDPGLHDDYEIKWQ